MYCPNCNGEYVRGARRCPSCGADLKGKPNAPQVAWVPVFESADIVAFAAAKSLLEEAGVPFVVVNPHMRSPLEIHYSSLMVPEDREAEAIEVVSGTVPEVEQEPADNTTY